MQSGSSSTQDVTAVARIFQLANTQHEEGHDIIYWQPPYGVARKNLKTLSGFVLQKLKELMLQASKNIYSYVLRIYLILIGSYVPTCI